MTEAVKSVSITNLDTTLTGGPVRNSTGEGAEGQLRHVNDSCLVSAAAAAGSTYRIVRFPTNAKVKNVIFEAEAMGAGKFDLGVYYSDSTVDGTTVANQGAVISINFFATDIDCASAVARGGDVNQSTNYPISKRNQPMWKALGLSVDPGGMFDLVATVHTTAVTTGAARIGGELEYVL